MDWKKYGYVIASIYRKKVIISLSEGPRTPKQISDLTEIHLSHVSSNLKDLAKEGIVECLTPELKRGRVYSLTEEGQEIVQELKRLV